MVEQNQGDIKSTGQLGYSGFAEVRINSTDNLVWIPIPVHRRISRHYSTKDRFTGLTPRKLLRGKTWAEQYDYGIRHIDRAHRQEYGDE